MKQQNQGNIPNYPMGTWLICPLLKSDQNEIAYSESIKFTKDYPSSGDAWRLLGRSAEKVNKPFEADKAWGVITKKAIPTQEVWWEGMISKARIRSTRRLDQACNLMRKMKRSEEYLPKKLKNDYGTLMTNLDCSVESGWKGKALALSSHEKITLWRGKHNGLR